MAVSFGEVMKKICVITTHPIQYVAPWLKELAELNDIQLYVIFLREPTPAQQGIGFGQALTWDVPLRSGYSNVVLGIKEGMTNGGLFLRKLHGQIRAFVPDLVLITGWNEPALALAYPYFKLRRIPVIVRGEANDLRQRGWVAKVAHRMLLGLVDAAVVIGSANRRFYEKSGMDRRRIYPGAYFVNTPHMLAMASANGSNRAGQRAAYGINEDDFVFAFAGKHVRFKRPHLLIEAAGQLKARGSNVKLLYAGSGELTEQLRQRAAELGVSVCFTGFLNQSEMWRAYVPADAFVLPSTNGETWGLVTNEAMLFGLPVIVCKEVGCAEDLVIEGETGYTFDGDAVELADAMLKLCNNPERARAMGQAGRERVIKHFSMPVATGGLLAAMDGVLGNRTALEH